MLLPCALDGGLEAAEAGEAGGDLVVAGLVTADVAAGVTVVAGRREDAEDAEVAAGGRLPPAFVNILLCGAEGRGSADCCCCALERERALVDGVVAAVVATGGT